MSNLPYHRPAEFELFRGKNPADKLKEKIQEAKSLAPQQCRDGGLWWAEQRFVNQVAPAEMVNPDNFDNFKYRYQLYARPPPVHCEPCQNNDFSHVTDEAAPLHYNVRRVAVDKKLPCELPCPERCQYRLNCPYGTSNNNNINNSSYYNNNINNSSYYNNNINSKTNNINNINNINYVSNNDNINKSINNNSNQEADARRANEENVGHDSDLDCLEEDNKLPYNNNEGRREVGGVTVNNQEVGGVCVVSDSFELNESSDWNENNNNDQWSSRATCGSQSEVSTSSKPAPGYGTYKIIGGHQYHLPQPYMYDQIHLPPAQAEFREFQRRCPIFSRGRYDHANPMNELMLSAHKSSTVMKSTLTPFCTLKNPHRNPLRIFAPEAVQDLTWPQANKCP